MNAVAFMGQKCRKEVFVSKFENIQTKLLSTKYIRSREVRKACTYFSTIVL